MNRIAQTIINVLKDSKHLNYCSDIKCKDFDTCDSNEVYCEKYIINAIEKEGKA